MTEVKNKKNKFGFSNQNLFLASFFFSVMLGFFLFFGTGKAWGATYYVSPTGDNSDGTTWAKAYTTIQAAITAKTESGSIIEIDGGSSGIIYVETIDAKASNITIKGSSESGHNGQVTINGSGVADEVFETSTYDNGTLQDVRLLADSTSTRIFYVQDGANNWLMDGCIFEGPVGMSVYDTSGKTLTIENSKFLGTNLSGSYSLTLEGAGTVNLYNNIFTPTNNRAVGYIRVRNTITLNMYNNTLAGFLTYFLYTTHNTVTMNVKNNVFVAGDYNNGSSPVINDDAGGTITFGNNLYLPSAENPASGLGLTDDGTNISDSSPGFNASGVNKGYVILTVDDGSATGADYAQDVADKCDELGINFTWFIDQERMMNNDGYASIMQNIVDGGNEVGLHSYSHSAMTLSTAFTVQKTGQTIDIDRNADTITVSGVAPYSGYKTKSLNTIRTWLAGTAGCTLGSLVTNLSGTALGEALADTSGAQSIDAAYTLNLDKTQDASQGYFKSEIADVKSWIETTIGDGYTVKTSAPPGSFTDETYQDALKASDLLGGRGSSSGGRLMTNLTVFDIRTYASGHVIYGDESETQLKRNGAALAQLAATTGNIYVLLTHNSSEMTIDEIDYFMEGVLSVEGIEVVTLATALDHIRSSGLWTDADGDGERWTRTFINSSDYSLQSTSPAIDAGTDVSLTTDFEGNPIYGLPDIGGYEFQPPFEIGTDEIDVTAGARIYGDGKFRDYGEEGEGETASLSVAPESGEFTTYGDDEVRPFWMDITDITWGSGRREWKESSGTLGETNTLHTISNLTAGNTYTLTIDSNPPTGIITGTDCDENGVCVADGSGQIAFVYTGGYSEHTFSLTGEDEEEAEEVEEDDDQETDLNVNKVEATSTQDSITIEWKTDHKTKSTVRYGTDKNMEEKKKDDKKEKKHKITIDNLLPDTRYFFRVKATDGDDNEDKSRIHTIRTKSSTSNNTNTNTSKTVSQTATNNSSNSTPSICSYIVQEGDTLWGIAKKAYGDATAYSQIIEKNQNRYPDIASKLSIGQELTFGCEEAKGISDESNNNSNNRKDNENRNDNQNQIQESEYARWWNPFSWF